MNATHQTSTPRPASAEARFAPAFRDSPRQTGYSAANSYSQRRYTAKTTTPLFRCS